MAASIETLQSKDGKRDIYPRTTVNALLHADGSPAQVSEEGHTHSPSDVGADPAGAAQVVQGNLQTHMADADNPHKVLPVQVGGIPIVTTYTPEGGVDGVDYACDVPGVTEYYQGLTIRVKFHCNSKTQKPMLNANNLGSRQIMLASNDIMERRLFPYENFFRENLVFDLWLPEPDGGMQWSTKDPMFSIVATGGTGLISVPNGSYLVGKNGRQLQTKTPDQVRAHIGASKPVWAEVTFPAAGWTLEGGVYVQTVACAEAKAEMKGYPNVGLKKSTDAAARELEKEAYALIETVDTLDGQIKAACGDKAPQVAITLLFSGGVA